MLRGDYDVSRTEGKDICCSLDMSTRRLLHEKLYRGRCIVTVDETRNVRRVSVGNLCKAATFKIENCWEFLEFYSKVIHSLHFNLT